MDAIYASAAVLNLIACLYLGFLTRSKLESDTPPNFKKHLTEFLVAWTLCITGEWFVGPAVYNLYASYELTHHQIAQLFVLGFAWSSILGCFAGAFADKFGRKRSALLLCTLGVLTCMLKHFNSYPLLLISRFLDGAHASLLYTAFESWLVSEHFVRHSFPPHLLSHSFALMFSMSYLVAILAGFADELGLEELPSATFYETIRVGQWSFPFEMSAFFQAAGGIYIAYHWQENYGVPDSSSSSPVEVNAGLMTQLASAKVLLCCVMVSFFESSMFIFVFSWTPTLSPASDHTKLPAGMIFATYMMACMSGAACYRMVEAQSTKHIMLGIFVVACMSMAVPTCIGVSETTKYCNYFAFLVFEFCVGAYFPAAATLKSELVPENHRITIYNFFRTPMNLIVVAVLLVSPSGNDTFTLLFSMLFLGSVLLAYYCFSPGSEHVKLDPLLK